jgi:phosphohistidine phosphatase SixA
MIQFAVALRVILFAAIALFTVQPAFALSDAGKAALQKGGYVILMRHAQTTGTGDPAGMTLADCKTQRNLNDKGREQARALGAVWREAGVRIMKVLSSPWCRCTETAALIIPDVKAEVRPELGSFLNVSSADRQAPTAAMRREIEAWRGPGNLLMVSHQINIDEIADRTIAQGAYLIIDPNGRRIVSEER